MLRTKSVFFAAALSFAAIFVQVGCDDDDDTTTGGGGGGGVDSARIMIVHAIPGGPSVDLYLDTMRVRNSLSYPNNTGYIAVTPGSRIVRAKNPGDTTVIAALGPFTVTNGLRATIFAAADTVPVILYDTLTTPSTGKANVRFVNLAVGSLNVASFIDTSTTQAAAVAYKSGSRFMSIDAGQHIVNFRAGATSIASTSSYNFVAGKSYTVWLRGIIGGTGVLAPGVEVIANN